VSIIHFADDTVIMCDAARDRILGHILLCFEDISGLEVNIGKSE